MMDSVTTIGLIACDGRVVILSAILVVRVDQSVGCVYARSVSSGDKYDEINILFKLATYYQRATAPVCKRPSSQGRPQEFG